jgi:hypothetical protein
MKTVTGYYKVWMTTSSDIHSSGGQIISTNCNYSITREHCITTEKNNYRSLSNRTALYTKVLLQIVQPDKSKRQVPHIWTHSIINKPKWLPNHKYNTPRTQMQEMVHCYTYFPCIWIECSNSHEVIFLDQSKLETLKLRSHLPHRAYKRISLWTWQVRH